MKHRLGVVLRLAALAAVASGAVLFAGLAAAAGERLAAFYKNQVDPHFALVRAGVEAAAKDMGAGPVTHYAPTRPNNLAEQLSEIEDVTVKKPDAILFMAVDPRGVVPAIEKVNAAGIPLVNYNDRVRGGKFVSYVAADDFNLGLDAGRYLLKALGGKGNVVIIEGRQGLDHQRRSRARLPQGARREPERQAARLATRQLPAAAGAAGDGKSDPVESVDRRGDGRGRRHGVRRDRGARGGGQERRPRSSASAACRNRSKPSRPGRLLATAEFNGYKMGCLATMAALRSLRKEPVPDTIVIKGIVIDKTTTGPFEVPAEKRTCPKWEDYAK